ncbi:MAG: GAF domain-containing protein [Coprobacillaceae bacterium]
MKEMYELMIKQLDNILTNETNTIGNLANASALLFQTLPNLNWAGFYLYNSNNDELILGPFQGKVACMHIPMNRGVCGTSAYTRESMLVEDVHAFPGHIACDSASNSEIVIPIVIEDVLYGILDLDAPIKSRFTKEEQLYL